MFSSEKKSRGWFSQHIFWAKKFLLDFWLFFIQNWGRHLKISPCLFGQCNFYIFIKDWKRIVRLSVIGGREKRWEETNSFKVSAEIAISKFAQQSAHLTLAGFSAVFFHSSRLSTFQGTPPQSPQLHPKIERISWNFAQQSSHMKDDDQQMILRKKTLNLNMEWYILSWS